MSRIAVSEEGVQALKAMASNILNAVEHILNITNSIESVADERVDTLGPHYTSLVSAITEIREAQKQAIQPATELSESLNDVAEGYQEIIDNDKINTSDGENQGATASSAGSNGKSGSFFGKIFGGGKTSTSGNFGSFETGKYPNGDYAVKGDNYDQYMSDYNNSENTTYQSLGDNSFVESVPSSSIEGIHLNEGDVNNPGRFWSQHDSEGTIDSFKEVASHIPEVKSQLDSGRSLTELENDPVLGKCASIYFDPSEMPRVTKNDGYYEFQDNGRHRVLAARELGYDIPVKVIGIRKRNK